MSSFTPTSLVQTGTQIIPNLSGPDTYHYVANGLLINNSTSSTATLSIDKPFHVDYITSFFDYERSLTRLLYSYMAVAVTLPNNPTVGRNLYRVQQIQGLTTTDGSALTVQPVAPATTEQKYIDVTFPEGTFFYFTFYFYPANIMTKWNRLQMVGYYESS